jgi:hypothetical protein
MPRFPKRLDDSLVLLDVGVGAEHLARQKRRMSALQLGERDDALRGDVDASRIRLAIPQQDDVGLAGNRLTRPPREHDGLLRRVQQHAGELRLGRHVTGRLQRVVHGPVFRGTHSIERMQTRLGRLRRQRHRHQERSSDELERFHSG